MTVKVALVISDKNYRASPSGKGSIRKVQTAILFFVVQKFIYSFNWKSVFNVNYFK